MYAMYLLLVLPGNPFLPNAPWLSTSVPCDTTSGNQSLAAYGIIRHSSSRKLQMNLSKNEKLLTVLVSTNYSKKVRLFICVSWRYCVTWYDFGVIGRNYQGNTIIIVSQSSKPPKATVYDKLLLTNVSSVLRNTVISPIADEHELTKISNPAIRVSIL